jgi:hypothetical protein
MYPIICSLGVEILEVLLTKTLKPDLPAQAATELLPQFG